MALVLHGVFVILSGVYDLSVEKNRHAIGISV